MKDSFNKPLHMLKIYQYSFFSIIHFKFIFKFLNLEYKIIKTMSFIMMF